MMLTSELFGSLLGLISLRDFIKDHEESLNRKLAGVFVFTYSIIILEI